MATQINQDNLVEHLRAAFPELEYAYQERVRKSGGEVPSSYEVVGFVLKPRLKEDIATGSVTEFIKRSASFFEKVCAFGDVEALNVIWIKVFEWLISEPQALALMWPVLGKQTKAAIKNAAKRWGYGSNLP